MRQTVRMSAMVVGVVLLLWLPGSAQIPPGRYVVYGSGTITCGKWTAERQEPSLHTGRLNWVLGYITGAAWQGETIRLTDSDGIDQWLDRYCAQNPLVKLEDATKALISDLK